MKPIKDLNSPLVPWFQLDKKDRHFGLAPILSTLENPGWERIEDILSTCDDQYVHNIFTETKDIKEYINALCQLWTELSNDDVSQLTQLSTRLAGAIGSYNNTYYELLQNYTYWKRNHEEDIEANNTLNAYDNLVRFKAANRFNMDQIKRKYNA